MTTSESKGQFFLQNESIRVTNRINSNRELECSTLYPSGWICNVCGLETVRNLLSNLLLCSRGCK